MLTRRNFLASIGGAVFALDISELGTNALAAAPGNGSLTLNDSDVGRLNVNHVAPWTPPPVDRFQAQDWATAIVALDNSNPTSGGYADGFTAVDVGGGELLATVTINDHGEGQGTDTHTAILHSADGGVTWQQTGVMEPPEAPESAYGTPWVHPSGRVYVIYTYNADDIRAIPNNADGTPSAGRVDCVGVIGYRSSTDRGHTWSARREIRIPTSTIDLRNPFGGSQIIFWMGPGPVVTAGNNGYLGLSKIGVARSIAGGAADTEAFLIRFTETSPGVLAAAFSAAMNCGLPNTEEPCPIVFDDGVINCTYRSTTGELGEAWSTDGGATWAVGWATDQTGATIAQPRAGAVQLRLPDGRYFLWHHNSRPTTANQFLPRNMAFYRIGERVGNRIVWDAPKLLLWDRDPDAKISGPCFLFDEDSMTVASADKLTARLLRFPLVGL